MLLQKSYLRRCRAFVLRLGQVLRRCGGNECWSPLRRRRRRCACLCGILGLTCNPAAENLVRRCYRRVFSPCWCRSFGPRSARRFAEGTCLVGHLPRSERSVLSVGFRKLDISVIVAGIRRYTLWEDHGVGPLNAVIADIKFLVGYVV